MSDFERKIIHMPGTQLSPEVVLHRTLTKLASIKAVSIVIQWDDDTFDADWSQMKTSELCMAAMMLDLQAKQTMQGERV